MPISFGYRMQTQPYDDAADNALRVEEQRNSLLKTQQMVEQQRQGELRNALMGNDWKGAAAADPQRAGQYLGQADQQRERALQAIAGRALGIYQAPSPRAAAQSQGLLEAFAQEAGKPPEALTDDEIRSMALADATKTGVVDVSKLKGPPQAPVPYEQSDDYKRLEHEYKLRERQARLEAGLRPPPQADTPSAPNLPTSALKIADEAQQAINASSESLSLVDRALATVEGGKVNLGLVNNAIARTRNALGKSDDNSRAFTDVQQTLEKLRNNYLLLAKGVQTEGDAIRAWNSEIGESVQNDNKLAAQQLRKAKALLERGVDAQNARIEQVYANFGRERPAPAGGKDDPLGIR